MGLGSILANWNRLSSCPGDAMRFVLNRHFPIWRQTWVRLGMRPLVVFYLVVALLCVCFHLPIHDHEAGHGHDSNSLCPLCVTATELNVSFAIIYDLIPEPVVCWRSTLPAAGGAAHCPLRFLHLRGPPAFSIG